MLNSLAVPRQVESRTRVRYAETDQMGIAHHANYIVWFEIGRTELCRETGVSYREIESRGLLLVVTEIACEYRIPYRYDDEVVIRTSVAEAGSRAMQFAYALYDVSGNNLHATGKSRHYWLDQLTRKPARAPNELVAAFAEWR